MTTANEIETLAGMVKWPVRITGVDYHNFDGIVTTANGVQIALFSNDRGWRLALRLMDADDALRGKIRTMEDVESRRRNGSHGFRYDEDDDG